MVHDGIILYLQDSGIVQVNLSHIISSHHGQQPRNGRQSTETSATYVIPITALNMSGVNRPVRPNVTKFIRFTD